MPANKQYRLHNFALTGSDTPVELAPAADAPGYVSTPDGAILLKADTLDTMAGVEAMPAPFVPDKGATYFYVDADAKVVQAKAGGAGYDARLAANNVFKLQDTAIAVAYRMAQDFAQARVDEARLVEHQEMQRTELERINSRMPKHEDYRNAKSKTT